MVETSIISFGKYRLIEKLGEGTFGVVWRALDPVLERELALKEFRLEWAALPRMRRRIMREARAAADLVHPHISLIYEVDEMEGRPYLAMRIAKGVSLRKLLDERGCLSWTEAKRIVRETAAALDFAYARKKLIHCDIKPDNILFSPEDGVVVTDFGLAKLRENRAENRTHPNGESSIESSWTDSSSSGGDFGRDSLIWRLGTASYRPPELWILEENKKAGPATDVYSLACILVEMLTGKKLFDGPDEFTIGRAQVNDTPPLPEVWPEGTPGGVSGVLARALAKKIDGRYANAASFFQALEEAEKEPTRSEIRQYMANRDWAGALEAAARLESDAVLAGLQREVARQLRQDLKATLKALRDAKHAGEVKILTLTALEREDWTQVEVLAQDWMELSPQSVRARNALAKARSHMPKMESPLPANQLINAVTPNPVVKAGTITPFRAETWNLPDEPRLGFIEISTGKFRLGSDPAQDPQSLSYEQPQHLLDLPLFYLARYPVTVAQFRVFCVTNKTIAANVNLEGKDDYPVVNINWREALAYCDWLEDRLENYAHTPPALHNLLARGWRVTLPSEAEWEKAARGADGRIFAWGNTFDPARANTSQGGPKHISAVNAYPEGASPYGVMDLCGNVWEWTRSIYRPYEYNPWDGREELKGDGPRVLRGGSWYRKPELARCAYRSQFEVTNRMASIGFRVAIVKLG